MKRKHVTYIIPVHWKRMTEADLNAFYSRTQDEGHDGYLEIARSLMFKMGTGATGSEEKHSGKNQARETENRGIVYNCDSKRKYFRIV